MIFLRIIVVSMYVRGKNEDCVCIWVGCGFCSVFVGCWRWLIIFLFKILFEVEIDCISGVFLFIFGVEFIFGGNVFKFIGFKGDVEKNEIWEGKYSILILWLWFLF